MGMAKIDVMSSEKRFHQRRNIASEQIPGEFFIVMDNRQIPFQKVNDVSISGLGIRLSEKIAKGTQLQIGYQSPDFSLRIDAEVAWQERLAKDDFRIGIQFSTRNVNDNVMLFMTLREYIDDFGESF